MAMDVSPIDLQKALHGASYPASRNDLVECARGNDAPQDVMDAISGLPEQEYDSPSDVTAAASD